MARLQEHYKKVVVQDLMKKFGYKSGWKCRASRRSS